MKLPEKDNRPHTEDESAVSGDGALLLIAVPFGRRYGDKTLSTSLHTRNADIPTLDDLTCAESELEL